MTPSTKTESSTETASYGQVIEYVQGLLYLAAYSHEPNEKTPFPYEPVPRSPSKRSSRSHSKPTVVNNQPPLYFSVDDSLLYNRFHHDFGPLHIGHLYRFAVELHDMMWDPANEGRRIVFWSHMDSRSRANAACLLACYMILIQSWPPHLALAPISQLDPPLMPFRDAGCCQADYILTVQDIVYGVWKAKEQGLCKLDDFDINEYEKFERVDGGDFNWLTPSFVAFASPQHPPPPPSMGSSPLKPSTPPSSDSRDSTVTAKPAKISRPFKIVLSHFSQRNVGLVVRLNSALYPAQYFTTLGINHIDMIFDDGTCPPLALVRKFIKIAHETINIKQKAIAVHCKAGLGRTGCLIGAYLIYRHGFTANEVIAYMRFMRPGMVVGPQQHWLTLNQSTFRDWWWEDAMKEKLSTLQPTTPKSSQRRSRIVSTDGQTSTPPNGSQKRPALGEIDHNESGSYAINDENLPAPTPGQPRKSSRMADGGRGYPNTPGRAKSGSYGAENDASRPDTEIVTMHRQSHSGDGEADSEEEWHIARRTSHANQLHSEIRRAVSTTTLTTTRVSSLDVENSIDEKAKAGAKTPGRERSPSRSRSGAGSLAIAKVRGGHVRGSSQASSGGVTTSGVRKTSARIASAGGPRSK